jgi:hypothetical protein
MNDLIRKFGNVTLDVREITCIGEPVHIGGTAVAVDIYLKACGKVNVNFDSEELAKKELDWLSLTWIQAVK